MKAEYSIVGSSEFILEFEDHIKLLVSVYGTYEELNVQFESGYVTPNMLRLTADVLEACSKKGGVLNQFE